MVSCCSSTFAVIQVLAYVHRGISYFGNMWLIQIILCCEVHFCRQHCSYAQIFHIPDSSKFIEFCHITSIEYVCCEAHFYRQRCPYAQIFHIHDSSKSIGFWHITAIEQSIHKVLQRLISSILFYFRWHWHQWQSKLTAPWSNYI